MAFLNQRVSDPLNRRIALTFGLAAVLIAFGFVLSFYSYHRYDEDRGRVQHTHDVISQLEGLLSSLKDVETGVRGYIVDGDAFFLEPYRASRSTIPKQFRQLRQLVADNPAQRRQADTLGRFVRDELVLMDRNVREAGRLTPALRSIYLRIGKFRMDRVRVLTAQMIHAERTLMNESSQQAARSFRRTLLLSLALFVLTFLTLAISYRLLQQELRRRQQNEDQLRAYEMQLRAQIRQLETSNEELERFAFAASHDLQEPLRKIQAFAALVTDRYGTLFNDESLTFMNKIRLSAERMSKLIKDLLNFSRLSSHREAFQPVALDQVVRRILDDQELRIKGLNVRVEVGPLPVVEGISSQIEQLFANLIANALKFTRPDVQPLLRLQTERIDGSGYNGLTADRPYVRITVEDNGIGFDEKYLDHIFKVFQRLHGKGEFEGTGIGLAICRRVVVYHSGHITAHSRPGQGTTFVVVLPERQSLQDYDRSNSVETHSYFAG